MDENNLERYDLILLGGGLANALIAWRMRQRQPHLRLLMLEAGSTLGGNHTWSFHRSDLTPAQWEWMGPLIQHRWKGHEVRFPAHRRVLQGEYASLSSTHLHAVMMAAMPEIIRLGCAGEYANGAVRLKDGTRLHAAAAIDGRGHLDSAAMDLGYQKFLGLEVALTEPHGLSHPILMDATVPQLDGYRFVYTLPLTPTSLLIEDTRYSDGPALADAELRAEALAYADAQGWKVRETLREERGILPIALGGDIHAFWREAPRRRPCAGMRAGLFHATTGYSLPQAARLADALAARPFSDMAELHAFIHHHASLHWRRQRFYRLLNRMLFRAALPHRRYLVLQRFYRLPEPLILRFYAGASTLWDRARILIGKPPVPIFRALRCLRDAHPFRKA